MRHVVASGFLDEMTKISHELELPLNKFSPGDAESLLDIPFVESLLKIAAPRAVKEWRAANAAGNASTADSIAQGYGAAGLKPRYLNDVSLGGAEAGVDRMMGDVRHSTGQMPTQDPVGSRRALFGRLDQMKANKGELGLEGRSSTQSVRSSPEGRAALLRGASPTPATGAAPNESGYVARKMYKPDSFISQAEFTPQHVQQKMDMTQAARGLSPEARAMVPDMYGMKTMGAGPTQRTMSYHEFVPGMQDLRGKNIGTEDKPVFSKMPQAAQNISDVKQNVLQPLAAKGMTMGDVTGERGTNWGNVARAGDGSTKVVDFLPSVRGQSSPAMQSFGKYAPMPTMRHSAEGGGTVTDLRKEMFKPTMESRPASAEQVSRAMDAHGAQARPTAPPAQPQSPLTVKSDPFKAPVPTPSPVSAVAPTAPRPGMGQAPTSIVPPKPGQGAATAPAIPRAARVPAAQLQPAATGAATPQAMKAPSAPAMPHPSVLPTRPAIRGGLGALHR